MKLLQHDLPGVYDVSFETIEDARGGMEKLYSSVSESHKELTGPFEQILISHTKKANTVRGLYLQAPPFQEAKLIRILSGSVFWVAVDLRPKSEFFGRWTACTLSETRQEGMYIERGFAHGCLILQDDTKILLMADNIHQSSAAYGIKWDDSELGIDWPLLSSEVIISSAHAAYPAFSSFRENLSEFK